MIRNKSLKKLLSLVISASTVLSTVVVPSIAHAAVDATDSDYSTGRADISFEYIGTSPAGVALDDEALTNMPHGDIADFEWEKDGYVWVGVYIENLKRQEDMFTDPTTPGLNTLALNITYDKNYLSLSPTDVNKAFDWINGVQDYYLDEQNATYPYLEGRRGNTAGYKLTFEQNSIELIPDDQYKITIPLTLTNLADKENIIMAKQAIRWDSASGVTQKMFDGDYMKNDKTLVAIYPLKMVTDSAPSAGTRIIEGLFGPTMVINAGRQVIYSWVTNRQEDYEVNLNNRFNVTQRVVDICPASATDYVDSLTKGGTASTLLESYVENQKFNPSGLTFKPHFTESGDKTAIAPTDTDYKDLKFYLLDNTGETNVATIKNGTEITKDTALTTAMNNKYIYAVYTDSTPQKVSAAAEVGQIKVASKAISNITINSASNLGKVSEKPYYTTTNIYGLLTAASSEKLSVDIAYNDGSNTTDADYATFGSNGIALYILKDGKLAVIDSEHTNVTFVEGVNTLYVAAKGYDGKALAEVTTPKASHTTNSVSKDTLKIANASGTAAELHYADNATFTTTKLNNLIVNTYTASAGADSATTNQKLTAVGIDKVKFYYGADAASAKSNEITPGTTTYSSSSMKDKKLFVAHNDDPDNLVEVGTLGDREPQSAIDPAAISGTYGDTVSSKMPQTLTVTFDNGETDSVNVSDLTIKIDGTEVQGTAVLTPNNKKVEFYSGTTKLTETTLSIAKKEITYTYTGSAGSKVYNGTTALPTTGDTTPSTLKAVINKTDLVTGDQTGITETTVDVTGLTFAFENANAGTKNVNATGTATVASVTDFDKMYTLKAPTTALTGTITKKALTIKNGWTNKTANSTVKVGDTEGLTKTGLEWTLTKDYADVVGNDTVDITYNAVYDADDVAQAGNPEVTVSNIALKDTNGNYTIAATLPQDIKVYGNVANKVLSSISVATAPTNNVITYPTRNLNLTGLEINMNYDGSTTPTKYDLDTFFANDGQIKVNNSEGIEITLTKANYQTEQVKLAYGETTLTIAISGKTTTTTVTAKKKPIKLSEITISDVTSVYGGEATGTITLPNNAVEADDTVTTTGTFTFTDANAGTDKEVTVSAITLTGDDAGNYEIVDDNGALIASPSKTATGTITPAKEAVPNPVPEIDIDPKTNKLVVTVDQNVADKYVYSVDNGTTWISQAELQALATNLGQTLNVKVATKASDANHAMSDPADIEAVTTFTKHVRAFKKGANAEADTPAAEMYTNTESAADAQAIHNIIGGKPSRFKSYFTATECGSDSAVTYPYAITADTVLYFTQTSGGGGGSGSSVSIKFDKTEFNGTVGGTDKITATVTGSTAAQKWTSSDEKVVTVDDKGNLTYVGEGTATIKVSVGGTVKTAKVTVKAGEPTVEPTIEPTVEPTQKPVIDPNFTKPYASGYDEGDFRPDNSITRAELAAMIARLSYGDDLPDGMYKASFPDVSEDAWYNKYIGYLEGLDVITGYEDGDFRPNNTISRGEIATVIARAQRYEILPYDGRFADVLESDWPKDYIMTLADKGIVSGYDGASFGPYSPLTRAEAVTIINKVLAPSTAIVNFVPSDIDGHWAYDGIILAVNDRVLGDVVMPTEAPQTEVENTEAPVEVVPTTEPEAPAPTEAPVETPAENAENVPTADPNLPTITE